MGHLVVGGGSSSNRILMSCHTWSPQTSSRCTLCWGGGYTHRNTRWVHTRLWVVLYPCSSFTWHHPCNNQTVLQVCHWGEYLNHTTKIYSHSFKITGNNSTASLLENGKQRYIKTITKNNIQPDQDPKLTSALHNDYENSPTTITAKMPKK